eukprot:Skav200659  [mRNA]  locus=scaffold3198:51246:62952:- [translate_table: standard]
MNDPLRTHGQGLAWPRSFDAGFTSSLAQKGRGEHEEYPVGRGRLEPVGVMICAVVMGMASMEVISQLVPQGWQWLRSVVSGSNAWGLGQMSTLRLVKYWDRNDAPEVALTLAAAMLLVGVIFLKAGLWQWCKRVYERNPQDAVKAIAQDNLNDVISNIAALLAPEMILLGHQFWLVDPFAGIGISIGPEVSKRVRSLVLSIKNLQSELFQLDAKKG